MNYKTKESGGTKIGIIEFPMLDSVVYIVYEKEASGWANHIDALTMLNGRRIGEHEVLEKNLLECAGEVIPDRGACLNITKMPVILLREEYAITEVVLHECVHAGQTLLMGCGINDRNGEAEAYFMSYIFKVCKEFLENEFGVKL